MRQNRGWIDALLMILFLHIILNMVQIDAYLIEMLMLRKQKKHIFLEILYFQQSNWIRFELHFDFAHFQV